MWSGDARLGLGFVQTHGRGSIDTLYMSFGVRARACCLRLWNGVCGAAGRGRIALLSAEGTS